jgi:hypothetical protein
VYDVSGCLQWICYLGRTEKREGVMLRTRGEVDSFLHSVDLNTSGLHIDEETEAQKKNNNDEKQPQQTTTTTNNNNSNVDTPMASSVNGWTQAT